MTPSAPSGELRRPSQREHFEGPNPVGHDRPLLDLEPSGVDERGVKMTGLGVRVLEHEGPTEAQAPCELTREQPALSAHVVEHFRTDDEVERPRWRVVDDTPRYERNVGQALATASGPFLEPSVRRPPL